MREWLILMHLREGNTNMHWYSLHGNVTENWCFTFLYLYFYIYTENILLFIFLHYMHWNCICFEIEVVFLAKWRRFDVWYCICICFCLCTDSVFVFVYALRLYSYWDWDIKCTDIRWQRVDVWHFDIYIRICTESVFVFVFLYLAIHKCTDIKWHFRRFRPSFPSIMNFLHSDSSTTLTAFVFEYLFDIMLLLHLYLFVKLCFYSIYIWNYAFIAFVDINSTNVMHHILTECLNQFLCVSISVNCSILPTHDKRGMRPSYYGGTRTHTRLQIQMQWAMKAV